MGRETKARNSGLNGTGGKTGRAHRCFRDAAAAVSTAVGSLRRRWAGAASPSPLPSRPFIKTVFGGRGQNQYWSQNLAAACHSTRPSISCPKTSSITKKGNCENTRGQPLPHTSTAILPARGGRLPSPVDGSCGRCAVRGGRACTEQSGTSQIINLSPGALYWEVLPLQPAQEPY